MKKISFHWVFMISQIYIMFDLVFSIQFSK